MFKVGDKVVCINIGSSNNIFRCPLEINKVYTVEKVTDSAVWVDNSGWYPWRFESIEIHEFNKDFEELLEQKTE